MCYVSDLESLFSRPLSQFRADAPVRRSPTLLTIRPLVLCEIVRCRITKQPRPVGRLHNP